MYFYNFRIFMGNGYGNPDSGNNPSFRNFICQVFHSIGKERPYSGPVARKGKIAIIEQHKLQGQHIPLLFCRFCKIHHDIFRDIIVDKRVKTIPRAPATKGFSIGTGIHFIPGYCDQFMHRFQGRSDLHVQCFALSFFARLQINIQSHICIKVHSRI